MAPTCGTYIQMHHQAMPLPWSLHSASMACSRQQGVRSRATTERADKQAADQFFQAERQQVLAAGKVKERPTLVQK